MRALWFAAATMIGGCILEDNPAFLGGLDELRPMMPGADLCAGTNHTCAVANDGSVWCWGSNRFGQLGTGTHVSSPKPVRVELGAVGAVACGDAFTCAALLDGTVSCWGRNQDGALGYRGDPERTLPRAVQGIFDAVQVAAGSAHACALLEDQTVVCWGRNWHGVAGGDEAGPTRIDRIEDAIKVVSGSDHACVLRSNGRVRCWGRNHEGQAGADSTQEDNRDVSVPVSVDIEDVVNVEAGGHKTCALQSNGTPRCWGSNGWGQLGPAVEDEGRQPWVPERLGRTDGVVSIGTGREIACVVEAQGVARCWGNNSQGQRGDTDPLAFTSLQRMTGGAFHTCAVDAQARLWSFGSDEWGQLGRGMFSFDTAPVSVVDIGEIAQIDAFGQSTCAVGLDGAAWCWGRNDNGNLGDGTTFDRSEPVRAAPDLGPISRVAVGAYHTCALEEAGDVWCWGGNWHGQLGNGDDSQSSTPVRAFSGAIALEAGYDHTCLIDDANTVWCWGNGSRGRLGSGNDEHALEPVSTGLSNVVELELGASHTCARTSGGSLYCWGANSAGRLGDGSHDDRHDPTRITTTFTPRDIALGDGFTCALSTDDALWCWGANREGQWGVAEPTETAVPERVAASLPGATAIGAGRDHLCVVQGGALSCAGANHTGQLGDGTGERSTHLVEALDGEEPVVAVAAGYRHTCALLEVGQLKCFGSFYKGQLGDGRIVDWQAPGTVALFE